MQKCTPEARLKELESKIPKYLNSKVDNYRSNTKKIDDGVQGYKAEEYFGILLSSSLTESLMSVISCILWVFVVHTLQISTSHSSQKKIKSSL
jgi:hypothetical protein